MSHYKYPKFDTIKEGDTIPVSSPIDRMRKANNLRNLARLNNCRIRLTHDDPANIVIRKITKL